MVDNTFLFYRTPDTRQIDVGFADPDNLPDAQKLIFTPSPDMVHSLNEEWKNNIVRKTPPKPSGRKIIQTDEGFNSWIPVISGTFEVNVGGARTKIHNFRKLPQADAYHISGVFGLQYPQGPSYLNIDPDDTLGFMIESTRGQHVGSTKEIMDFAIALSYGGVV